MRATKTQVTIIGLGILYLSVLSPSASSHLSCQERTLETVKDLSAAIDRYIMNHEEADRKFIARNYPANRKQDTWEWKEVKSWDEADAYFKDYYGYQDAGVHTRNGSVLYVGTDIWSESGDWYFYVNYYYDDDGRLLQVAADFRGSPDYVKILDFQYFNEYGGVLDHVIEYYDLHTGQRLTEKPHLEREIHDIPVYPKVSDLPFYSLLKVGLAQRKK
jgi:hypothetical protein